MKLLNRWRRLAAALLVLCTLGPLGCGSGRGTPTAASVRAPIERADSNAEAAPPARRSAYFGDLHIHTKFSYDAFMVGVVASPDDAYRYARGEPLKHPSGYSIRLRGAPLDFLGVTEHAKYMGVINALADPEHPRSNPDLAARLLRDDPDEIWRAMDTYMHALRARDERFDHPDVMRDTWQEVIAAAERHYRPGEFTTFIGYEYTPHPGYNMHRNVIFRGRDVPELPFSSIDSSNPEDLWRWLDAQRAQGREGLAIPHNPNWSAGHMFARQQTSGQPFDADYAELRMRNEPLVEVTQVKGTSETHPLLSPNDEWADFEIWHTVAGEAPRKVQHRKDLRGGYIRDAYLAGIGFESREGFNPYKFGLIGSSDSHNAGATYSESAYVSKLGATDGTPELRGSVPAGGAKGWPADPFAGEGEFGTSTIAAWSAAGIAGVWADENTREAIYDALRRKETFATSGPRIRVRFFAGFDFTDDLLDTRDAVELAYANGVPMGGDLVVREGDAPRFLAWALRDPQSAPLQRLQIVKGWIEDGEPRERVFDVACSDGAAPDPQTHRCPDNGARVNLADCSFTLDRGAAQLSTLWRDPSFDPAERAFYYVRVLENPSCRWSTWDAVRARTPPNPELATTLQERAWSSPIWYVPR